MMTERLAAQEVSEDSDNEPLSLIAEVKNGKHSSKTVEDSEPLELRTGPLFTKLFEKKKPPRKPEIVTAEFEIHESALISMSRTAVKDSSAFANTFITYVMPPLNAQEQLSDVWLDAKLLSQAGPMTCVVCMDCFVNKTKLIMHYVLNHRKAFCGTCRYLVMDAATWDVHWSFHLPLRCSHCEDEFMDERGLRLHYDNCHHLAHCRMCSLMLPSGPAYNLHLAKKHMVTVDPYYEEEQVWKVLQHNVWTFSCLLCHKANLQNYDFLRHFLYHHKFSLKCLTTLVNGKELGFSVMGASINTLNPSMDVTTENNTEENKICNSGSENNSVNGDENMDDSYQFLEALIPEIKQEVLSDDENGANSAGFNLNFNNELSIKPELETLEPGSDLSLATEKFLVKFSGREDFDQTLVEFMPIRKKETDYVNAIFLDMNMSIVTVNTLLNNEDEIASEVALVCPLCFPAKSFFSLSILTEHMIKQHSLKSIPNYTCRVCMTSCHTHGEMQKHLISEKQEYSNLYLCQICDEDFDSRASARGHLAAHWEEMKVTACTSPQLGLKCRYCSLLFWHEMERERHHCQAHYQSYRDHFYRCSTCQMIFSDKIYWASHEVQEHVSDRDAVLAAATWLAFKCAVCCRVFRDTTGLRDHFLDLHPTERRLYCAVAGCISKPFRINRYLKQHHEVVHCDIRGKAMNTGLQCGECGKVLRTQRAAATHRTVVHGDKAGTRFKCRICNHGLPSIQDRKLHYLVMHPGVAPFSCSVCGKGYNNKSALYTHRTQSHAVNMLTYTCSFCNKSFNKRDSYKEHLLIHVGPRHACPHCSRIFVQRSNMLRHIRLHTGEKPYPCLHCDKTFADKGACNSHVRTHTRQDVHTCIFCGQEFLQKQKLKYHLRKHTGEDLETCVICLKKFTNQTNLREHMKTHDDSCPVTCQQCGKVFMSRRYMERHARDYHSGTAEVHPCPLCGRACPRLSALRHHLLTHATQKHLQCLHCGKQYNGKKSINKHLLKRHGINITDGSYNMSIKQLDPRQCGLGLDEDTLSRVFGPEKNLKPKIYKARTSKSSKNYRSSEDQSDDDYKPAQKIEGVFKMEPYDSNNVEDDGPISGLELASLRTRVKRETSRNVKYSYGSDDDDDLRFERMSKKRNKMKFRRKYKAVNLQTESSHKRVLTHEEIPSQEEEEIPIFPLVEIKCEPAEYE